MIGKALAILAVVSLSLVAYNHFRQVQTKDDISDLRGLWATWKLEHGKSYASVAEEEARFKIFLENKALIDAHNAAGHSFFMVLNQFADLTNEEFGATYANCHGKAEGYEGDGDEYCPSAKNCPTLPTTNITAVNWTASGAVTPVKNQGQCGSCWAFSTTGAIEGLYYLKNHVLVSFSESQLVDCATKCDACNGCWPYLAMNYTAVYGLEPEQAYPYTPAQGSCKYNRALALNVTTGVGYQCVTQKDPKQLLAALDMRPVSIAVQANQASWQFYGGGVVNTLCGAKLDHAVLLTGYGTHKSGATAYYVKNSWGTSWGDKGYIWIGTNANANDGYGVCGILRCATLAV